MSPKTLLGQVALVTGAAQGIGAALAEAFAREGARVIVSDLLDVAGTVNSIRSSGGSAIGIEADVTDSSSLQSLVSRTETEFGPVSVLVNNAGIFGTLVL